MRTLLLLGLGNDVLTDDAIGLLVVKELELETQGWPGVEVRATTEMGLALLDNMVGFSTVFIVDSIQTGKAAPGFVHELDAGELKQITGRTPHFLGVGETLAMGRKLGLDMPEETRVFAIEVSDPFTLGTELTPALREAMPGIVQKILVAVKQWRGDN